MITFENVPISPTGDVLAVISPKLKVVNTKLASIKVAQCLIFLDHVTSNVLNMISIMVELDVKNNVKAIFVT